MVAELLGHRAGLGNLAVPIVSGRLRQTDSMQPEKHRLN